MKPTLQAIKGTLLGCAIGDALGLPYEGLSAKRAQTLLGAPTKHRLFFSKGFVSDDTEHLCMTALSLLEADGNVELFQKRLSSHLKRWFLAFPRRYGICDNEISF